MQTMTMVQQQPIVECKSPCFKTIVLLLHNQISYRAKQHHRSDSITQPLLQSQHQSPAQQQQQHSQSNQNNRISPAKQFADPPAQPSGLTTIGRRISKTPDPTAILTDQRILTNIENKEKHATAATTKESQQANGKTDHYAKNKNQQSPVVNKNKV